MSNLTTSIPSSPTNLGEADSSPGAGARRRSRDGVADTTPTLRRAFTAAVPSWWNDAAGVLTWASLLVVTALWVAAGGVNHTDSFGDALTSMGRLTGLLASDLLLIQVLLMARVPFVEKAYGQDELAVMHRLVGFGSFTLMMAHIVLIIVGYAEAKVSALWSTITYMVLDMPAMLMALAGTVALCMVVATSIKKARRALRYESWHLLHLYAYLGCFLALPHQLWTGADFLNNAVATAYWWGLWGLAVTAVLVFRVGLPVVRNLRHKLVVSSVRQSDGGVTVVTMTGRDLDRLSVRPGQFFNWRFLDGPGWTRSHPYSLSASPDGRTLEIAVAAVGDGTRRLASVAPGTSVLIEGPYGRMHPGVRTRRKVTLMAAGIGIAPMKALLEGLEGEPGDVTLIYRVSDRHNAALIREVAASAARVGARMIVLDGHRVRQRDSWLPQSWEHVSDAAALSYLVPDILHNDVYVCGSDAWMTAVETTLEQVGVDPANVHIERFSY